MFADFDPRHDGWPRAYQVGGTRRFPGDAVHNIKARDIHDLKTIGSR